MLRTVRGPLIFSILQAAGCYRSQYRKQLIKTAIAVVFAGLRSFSFFVSQAPYEALSWTIARRACRLIPEGTDSAAQAAGHECPVPLTLCARAG